MGAIAQDFAAMTSMRRQRAAPKLALAVSQPVMKGLRKRVWLLLYTEGGTWTAAEIAARLTLITRKIHSMLGEMVRDGFLVRRRIETVDGDTLVKYGVAGSCNVPRGVALEEIEQLLRMAVQGKPGAEAGPSGDLD